MSDHGQLTTDNHRPTTIYLTNAVKYGREGGTATLIARWEERALVSSVWNEGAGFTAEERPQLFGKFCRLTNDNTRSTRGSGLGLFLVESILSLHAGRVWAESEPGSFLPEFSQREQSSLG